MRGVGGVAHGRDVYAVSTSDDGTVRLWKLKSSRPRGTILTKDCEHGGPVGCAVVDDRPIALVGDGDDIHVWDLRTRERVGAPLPHTDMVSDIECTDIDGRPVAVSTSRDGAVRVWNLDVVITGGVPARPGHTEPFNAVACAVVDGRVVIVAGGGEEDSRQDDVAVWNLADGTPVGTRFGAGWGWVTAIATVIVDDTAMAVLATGHTNQLQLWNIADGTPRGGLRGHQDTVHAVAAATIGGRPLVISGGMDGMPLVWDLTDGSHVALSEDDPSDDLQSVALGDDGGTPVRRDMVRR